MNPLLNPLFLGRLIHSYLFDINRIQRCAPQEIKKYQDKKLRQIVRYAYTVPIYHQKYRKANIHPNDIHGLDDLEKLPFITKKDFRGSTKEMLLPKGSDFSKYSMVCTSGSTGKPVTLYSDPFTVFHTMIGFIRVIQEHGINWRKDKLALIADLSPDSAEYAYFSQTAVPNLKLFFSLINIKVFPVNQNPEQMLMQMDAFKPDFIGGYPGNLKILAVHKRRGKGESIQPRMLASSGAVIDEYTRKYIENAFDARLFDMYGATECSPMAFQCSRGQYHVNYDFVHFEIMDPQEKEQNTGDGGNLIITRLYGSGTPVIRYSGINDLVIPSETSCECDIQTPILSCIGGRQVDAIILPSGEMIPPLAITGIPHKVMNHLHTDKIQQFQIIQNSTMDMEVLIVIDELFRHIGPTVQVIFDELKNQFEKRLGSGIKVTVREVEAILQTRPGSVSPPPVVISKVVSAET